MAEWPATRAEAKVLGAKAYQTGNPCPSGHLAARRTHNGECVECGRSSARRKAREVPLDVKRLRDASYRARNAKAISERRRERYAANPEAYRPSPEKIAAVNAARRDYKRAWSTENKDRLNALARSWKRKNADKVREAKAEYYRKNPHVARLEAHRRRARLRQAEGSFTQQDVDRIFAQQKSRCACCGRETELTIDHIVPLSKGGTNWPRNLQGLCLSCNTSKQAKDPIAFMQERGALL